MIRVRLVLAAEGHLVAASAGGHASDGTGLYGANIVCAAVSTLLRSHALALGKRESVQAVGKGAAGRFEMRMGAVDRGDIEWLRGAGSVLIEGLRRLSEDEPGEVSLEVNQE